MLRDVSITVNRNASGFSIANRTAGPILINRNADKAIDSLLSFALRLFDPTSRVWLDAAIMEALYDMEIWSDFASLAHLSSSGFRSGASIGLYRGRQESISSALYFRVLLRADFLFRE